eukprot:4664364-Alexandrium_andersonii.AAC.2
MHYSTQPCLPRVAHALRLQPAWLVWGPSLEPALVEPNAAEWSARVVCMCGLTAGPWATHEMCPTCRATDADHWPRP